MTAQLMWRLITVQIAMGLALRRGKVCASSMLAHCLNLVSVLS